MTVKPRIAVSVTFLTMREGGRKAPPHNSPKYRPHIVIGDPTQRKAQYAEDGRTLIERYLGVQFTGQGEAIPVGCAYEASLDLPYYPDVSYRELERGATFTIREGARVVGFGEVKNDPWGDA